jgi:Transposase DDE domain
MRLVLLADPRGVSIGYDLVGPKTGDERDAVLGLAAAHAGNTVFADGGFWGREYVSSMELIGIELITPAKHKLSQRPAAEIAKARIRLVVESVFATLKRKMGFQDHLAKTLLASSLASPKASWPLASVSTSTPSSAAHHEHSLPTTDDEPPHQASSV